MRYNGISVCIICRNGTRHLHAFVVVVVHRLSWRDGVSLREPMRDSRRDSYFESTPTINSNRRRVGSLSSRVLSQVVESSKPQIAPTRVRKRGARGDARFVIPVEICEIQAVLMARIKSYASQDLCHLRDYTTVGNWATRTGGREVHDDYNRPRHNRGVIVIN